VRVLFASIFAVLSVIFGVMALAHLGLLKPQDLGINLHSHSLLAQAWELAHRRDVMIYAAAGLALVIVWGKVAVSVGSKK